MRYLELLEQIELVEAARDKYMPMLNFLEQIPEELSTLKGAKDAAMVMAEQAITTLGNSDRIVWAMRLIRINTLATMVYNLKQAIEKLSNVAGDANPADLAPEEQEAGARVVAKWRAKLALAEQTLKGLENLYNKDSRKMHDNAQKEIRADLEAANQKYYKLLKDLEALRDQAAREPTRSFEQSEETLSAEIQAAQRMVSILARYVDKPYERGAVRSFSWQALTNITHFLGIAYQPIHDYRFGWKTQDVVEDVLHEYETRWQNKKKRTLSHDLEEYQHIENILEFPGGKIAWFNLHKNYCDLEGAAMGHCGNSYENMKPGDEVLSLREYIGQDDEGHMWKPHLTFIYNTNDQHLSEMKGFKNNKPSEEYHRYIVPLLEEPWIKGIALRAHQHEKDNNFFISDLPSDEAMRLYKEKPALATFRDMKVLGIQMSAEDMPDIGEINTHLEELGLDEIVWEDEKNFILMQWDDWKDALHDIANTETLDPDDFGVPGWDDLDSIYDQFSAHTKQAHIDYVIRYYPAEARDAVQAEEDADMNEVRDELEFEQARSIMSEMNDEIGLDIIVKNWKEYHAGRVNEILEGMMVNLNNYFGNTGQDPEEEAIFKVYTDLGPYKSPDGDVYALTIDKDTFYNEMWPHLDENLTDSNYSWLELFGYHAMYYETGRDATDMHFDMEQETADWYNGEISMMSDDEVYRAVQKQVRGGDI